MGQSPAKLGKGDLVDDDPPIMLFKSKQGKQAKLNYNGRVTQASQKNFQLADDYD